MEPLPLFQRNWRLLAWQRWPDLSWPDRISRIGVPRSALMADHPQPEAIRLVEARFEYEHLLHTDVMQELKIDVFTENLRYLLTALLHGQMGQIARNMGVSLSTISRWAAGETRPRPAHLRQLGDELHLLRDLDLELTPLFLLETPYTHLARVQQVHRWIDRLPPPTLQALYPALERLLMENRDAL